LRFPVSARRYRLPVSFGASVSDGKNPVPNSIGQISGGPEAQPTSHDCRELSVSAGFVSSGVSCLWRRISVAPSPHPKIPFLADVVQHMLCHRARRPLEIKIAQMRDLVFYGCRAVSRD